MKITLLGGDKRSIQLANLFLEDGHDLKIFGFDNIGLTLVTSENLAISIEGSDVVIGPLPSSNDDKLLNTPLYNGEITIDEVFNAMTKKQIFIAGKVTKEILRIANKYDILTKDLLDREELAVLNAIPTAEGGVQVAMEEMDTTIHDSNVLVLGFGRIGKILSKIIHGMGANTFVEARRHEDLAWIKSYGYNPVHLNELKSNLSNMDLIFNTIPSMILTEENLLMLKKDCLVVDLASKPGGVNFEKAKELGIKTVWALGLPGKVAPSTAAKIMKDTIYNIIQELGE